jgi:hypothetical protein
VRDAAGIEHTAARVCGLIQIGVTVEVGQTNIGIHSLQTSDDTNGDGAVTAEDQRYDTPSNVLFDGVCNRGGDSDDGVDVSSRCIYGVGNEYLARDIASVFDCQPGSTQFVDQPALT